jgi:hypothetical protein
VKRARFSSKDWMIHSKGGMTPKYKREGKSNCMRTLASIGPYNSNLNYLRSRYHKDACEKCKVRGNDAKKGMYGCIQKMSHWTIARGDAHRLVGAIDLHHLQYPPSRGSQPYVPRTQILQRHPNGREDSSK